MTALRPTGRSLLRAVAAAALGGALACAGTTRPAEVPGEDFVAPMPAAPPETPAPHGHVRPAAGRELRVIDELVRVAERVRGLRLAHPVPVAVEDAIAIARYVETEIDPDALDKARVVYVGLGLIDPALDVRALLVELMQEQIVGYYDTKGDRLVVRDDVMRVLGRASLGEPTDGTGDSLEDGADVDEWTGARVVLVHEIVHALQDQHLELGRSVDAARDTDAENAFHSLIEGDAYLAMIASTQPETVPLHALTLPQGFRDMLTSAIANVPLASERVLARAPAIVRVPLLSAYVDGLLYCAALHAEGGWARIDRAHHAPPVSTEQVLHPERKDGHEVPVRVAMPGLVDWLTRAHYALVTEDTLGELEAGVYFGQGTPADRAPLAADGWGGDRLYAFRGPDRSVALVWLTTWDSERDADEAEYAARRVHASLAEETRARALVLRQDAFVLIARGLPAALHEELRASFARTVAPPAR